MVIDLLSRRDAVIASNFFAGPLNKLIGWKKKIKKLSIYIKGIAMCD